MKPATYGKPQAMAIRSGRIPERYRLFLYASPLLLLVFVFSYFPLRVRGSGRCQRNLHDEQVVLQRSLQALNGSVDAASLEPFTKALYESALEEREAPRKNMDAWSASQAYLLGGAVSKLPREMKESLFYGTTPSMEKYWPDLQRLEYDTYLKIITGELPIEVFDQFAQQWRAQGGDRIAAEVAEAVA